MPDIVENVVVQFTTDASQLDTALDTLEKTGQIDKKASAQLKQTNAELQKRQQLIKSTAAATQQASDKMVFSLEEVGQIIEKITADVIEGAQQGIADAFKEAGLEVDEFGKIVNKTNQETTKSTGSLKSELRGLTLQMAELKVRGEDTGEEYQKLAQRAGQLKDAIGDANSEVKNFGSDTKNIDGLISATQGLAGGFSIATGAEGLFGAQSEELQETLLKVNSAMAILQGFQAVGNVLQKESAASTFLQTAAQKIYNLVVGESIGLMAAFRIALASTGVGLLIIGIIALVAALEKSDKQLEQVNRELERSKEILDADISAIERLTEVELARAEAVSTKESDLTKIRGHSLVQQYNAIIQVNKQLELQRDALDNTSEGYFKLNKQIEDNNDRAKEIDNKIILERINLQKQLRTEELQGIADTLQARLDGTTKNSKKELDLSIQLARAKAAIDLNEAGNNLPKRLAIEADLQKQIRDLNRGFAQVQQQDRVAQTEAALTSLERVNRGFNERQTQQEIDLQKQLVREKARLDLLQEGLTQGQRTKILQDAITEQTKIQRDFNKQSSIDSINDLIDRNNAELSQLNISNSERLRLNEENLIAQAQIEIEQNAGLADKIKAIRAKLNEDLRALRIAAIQKELNDELELTDARTGALRRANERIVANENKTLQQRLDAINQLAALDIATVNAKQDALEEQLRQGLISQQDYNIAYERLKDDELKITEETEIKKRDLIRETNKQAILQALDFASQFINIIQQQNQQQLDAQQQSLDQQKQRIDDLREAGAITEKQALASQKKIDQEQRNLKRKQAQQDKEAAIFQAVINTAAAIVKALPNLVLAAFVGALGAAQVAVIASKPVPKFGKGKKNNYEGPAEIGETGPELLEHNGGMYLAEKSTLVWVGKRDKVFNPKETIAMLEGGNLKPYIVKEGNKYNSVYGSNIDYKKLGKVISDNIPRTGLNVDNEGFTMWVESKNTFVKYLDNRRSY